MFLESASISPSLVPTRTKELPAPGPPVIDRRLSLRHIKSPVFVVSAAIFPFGSAINICSSKIVGVILVKESSVPFPVFCNQTLFNFAVSMKLTNGEGGTVLSSPPKCSDTVCLRPHPVEMAKIKHKIKMRSFTIKLNST